MIKDTPIQISRSDTKICLNTGGWEQCWSLEQLRGKEPQDLVVMSNGKLDIELAKLLIDLSK